MTSAYYLKRAKAARRQMAAFLPYTFSRAAARGRWLAYMDMARAARRQN